MTKTMAEAAAMMAQCDPHHWVSTNVPGLLTRWVIQCSICGAYNAQEMNAAITAAGFGLVADAKAEALEEAAANILTNDPLDYWAGHLPEGLGFQEAMSRWLKAHAAVFKP